MVLKNQASQFPRLGQNRANREDKTNTQVSPVCCPLPPTVSSPSGPPRAWLLRSWHAGSLPQRARPHPKRPGGRSSKWLGWSRPTLPRQPQRVYSCLVRYTTGQRNRQLDTRTKRPKTGFRSSPVDSNILYGLYGVNSISLNLYHTFVNIQLARKETRRSEKTGRRNEGDVLLETLHSSNFLTQQRHLDDMEVLHALTSGLDTLNIDIWDSPLRTTRTPPSSTSAAASNGPCNACNSYLIHLTTSVPSPIDRKRERDGPASGKRSWLTQMAWTSISYVVSSWIRRSVS